MRTMKKHILPMFIAAIMIFGSISVLPGFEILSYADGSGSCGENVTWSLCEGTLTISGTGAMADYLADQAPQNGGAPWGDEEWIDCIDCIVIENGVTYIGAYSFSGFTFSNGTEITIPASVTSVSTLAFAGSQGSFDITFNGTEAQWGEISSAFTGRIYNNVVHFPEDPSAFTEIRVFSWYDLKQNTNAAEVSVNDGVTTVTLKKCIHLFSDLIIEENAILDLNGYGIRYNGGFESLIEIDDGTLTIKDTYTGDDRSYYISLSDGRGTAVSKTGIESSNCIHVNGGYLTGGDDLGCIRILDGSVTLDSGTIVGNAAKEDSGCGGGVHIYGEGCAFTMNGGSILNNNTGNGGGVFISDGTFVMNGGTIANNTANDNDYYGGGVAVVDGTFIMTGGTIENNSAIAGANIYIYSHGGEYIGKYYHCPDINVSNIEKDEESINKVIGAITTSATNGSIEVSAAAGDVVTVGETDYYVAGATVTVTETPATGYTLASLTATDTASNAITVENEQFTMPGNDVSVTATFEPVDYTITTEGEHGTVSAKIGDSEVGTAHYGDTIALAFEPEEGYVLDSVTVKKTNDTNTTVTVSGEGDTRSFTMPAYDVTVTANFERMNPSFTGHGLLLTGQIGVEFLITLPEGVNAQDTYMTFAGNHMDSNYQATAQATGDGRYQYIVFIPAYQMADQITPTLHYMDGNEEKTVVGDAYSAEEYITWGLADNHLTGDALNVVRALADYGYYSQFYLSRVNGWTRGTDYAAMTTKYSDSFNYGTTYSALASYDVSSDIAGLSYRLNFGSTTRLDIRFTTVEGQTVKLDGATVTPTVSDGYSTVSISGIQASQLTTGHQLQVGDKTVTISPMSYARTLLGREGEEDDLKKLLCAFYNYGNACAEYGSNQ